MSIHSRRFALAACALLPFAAACAESPEDVTQRFVDSVQKGEVSTAMDLVSAESREAIGDARLRNDLTSGSERMDDDEALTVVQGGDDVVSSDGRSAKVKVVPQGNEGSVSTIRLVKEGGAWKIDLSGEM